MTIERRVEMNADLKISLFLVDQDVQNLLHDLIDQIHVMNSVCDNVSIKLEPRHNNKFKKIKHRSVASKQKKRRIFSSSEDDSSSSSDDSLPSVDTK
jgi:hypothetical protein